MHGIFGIFIFIIAFFLIIAFMIGKFVFKVFSVLHNAKKAADNFNQGKGFNPNDYTSYRQSTNNNKATSDDETIVDTRDPNIAKRKIFSSKEGEYVKYKEEEKEERQD